MYDWYIGEECDFCMFCYISGMIGNLKGVLYEYCLIMLYVMVEIVLLVFDLSL